MNEKDFDRLIIAVEQQVLQSAAAYGLYWAHIGKPKFDEMVNAFDQKPCVFQAILFSSKLSMVVNIRKFWDRDPQAMSYHKLLQAAKNRKPDFRTSTENKIERIREKVKPWREDIRILRNRVYAHTDFQVIPKAETQISNNHTKDLILEMGRIFNLVMVELGGNEISPETIINRTYSEALSLWESATFL